MVAMMEVEAMVTQMSWYSVKSRLVLVPA